MAVIQISKIQVRRGLQENLPQLASAEFGWSIDQRRLFIGNGTLSEGAPDVGNTEILTQYTDILAVVNAYTFRGEESGYTSQTGASILNPIVRTLQNVLDERISVRDFGAVGDGNTDDTIAIQRALSQVYPVSQYNNASVRRLLHFPAGTYLVTSEIAVPTYATLVGDGLDATFIKQENASARSVITFSDSLGQVSPSIGDNGATSPNYIGLSGLTIWNASDNDAVYVDSVNNVRFVDVKFRGNQTNPTTSGTDKALVRIIKDATAPYNVIFDRCSFVNGSYGIYIDGDVYGVTVLDSEFHVLYQGVTLHTTGGKSPKSIKVTNNVFDNIAASGVYGYDYSSVVSAFNYFRGVGNGLSTTPTAPVIYFENSNNYSLSDIFDRTESEATVQPRIKSNISYTATTTSLNASGSLKVTPGTTDVLTPGSTMANTSLVLSSLNSSNAFIDYTLTKGPNVKTGSIRIAIDAALTNAFNFEDDYSEYPSSNQYSYGVDSPTGTQLSFVTYGTDIVMVANTSVTSGNVTLRYNLRRFT